MGREKNIRSAAGFTLVEVAVAVAILGLGLATLVSFQTRLLDTYVQEKSLLKATLAAQYMMSFVEIEKEPPEPGEQETDLLGALREKGYFDDVPESGTALETEFRNWKLVTKVTSVDYAEFLDILRRVELSVIWGEGSTERVSLILFLNTKKT